MVPLNTPLTGTVILGIQYNLLLTLFFHNTDYSLRELIMRLSSDVVTIILPGHVI